MAHQQLKITIITGHFLINILYFFQLGREKNLTSGFLFFIDNMLIAGVDEAGRGPALGPMVMAIVVASKEQEEQIVSLGVKDSKELSIEKRVELFEKIPGICEEFVVSMVEPAEINTLMGRHSLNEIEAMKIGEMINALKSRPEIVFVDSPDVKQENFSKRIKRYCGKSLTIKSEHFADRNYPLASAASVMAKVSRDNAIDELKKEFGDIGSGYPHDPKTIAFIRAWVKKEKELPPIARDKWRTNVRELNACFQKKLGDC